MAPKPAATVTPDEHGAYVTVVATILMAWMVGFICTRILSRLRYMGPWAADDTTILFGSLLGVGQTTATYIGVHNGFGTREKMLNNEQISGIEKAMYASGILYLIALCTAKIATLILLSRLTRVKKHTRATYGTIAFTCLWGLVSVLVISLTGDLSEPWTSILGGFPDLYPRWIGVTVVGILIEVAIFALALALVWDLHMAMSLKVTVCVAFAFRLLTIIPAAMRLVYISPSFIAADPTYLGVNAVMIMQVDVQYSLIAATIPCLRPFIRPFDSQIVNEEYVGDEDKSGGGTSNPSGVLTGTNTSRSTHASRNSRRSGQNVLSSFSSSGRRKNSHRDDPLRSDSAQAEREMWASGRKEGLRGDVGEVTTTIEHQTSNARPDSLSSDQLVIKQTRQWEVTYQTRKQ